jgi:Type I phosphodiesterase / nucleotide pyrophosphatase
MTTRRFLLLPLLIPFTLFGLLPSLAQAGTPRQSATAQYVVMIVLDGGRPNYIQNNIKSLPNLAALLKHSRWYDKAWVGSLMSITPPDHAVIGTGSLPKNDGGIVNWDWGVHTGVGHVSPTFQALSNYQNGYAFKVIRDSGTPTLSGEIRKHFPGGLVIAGSGAHFHAAGPMGGPDASWIFSYERNGTSWAPFTLGSHPVPKQILNDPTLREPLATDNQSTLPNTYDPVVLGTQDSLVISTGIRSLQLYRPRAMLLNLAEVDTVGHWSTKWHVEIQRVYKSFDRDLGRLIAAYKKAGIYNQTLFVITSDHGMIQSKTRVLDRDAIVSQVKGIVGDNGILLTNGGGSAGPTMTSIWLRNPANDEKVAKAIAANKSYDNISAIYYLTNTGGQYAYRMASCNSCSTGLVKAYDYLLSTEAGPTGEDVAILLRENARTSGLPQMLGRHGGADWGSQHATLILSGPGVKNGTSQAPARLADLAPTIERFMGITPNARDGKVLADAFQNPNAADVAAQSNLDATMGVFVDALAQRAQSDISLEQKGQLPNYVPANEVIDHWKRRWAVTIAGAALLIGTAIALAWAVREVRRQGTGLQWVD